MVTAPNFFETGALRPQSLPHWSLDTLAPFKSQPEPTPLALIFGNERHGVHPDWFSLAHMTLSVPMKGFTESLNLSVCAGILLYQLQILGYAPPICPKVSALLQDLWANREVPPSVIRRFIPEMMNYSEYLNQGHFFPPPLS